MYHSMKINVKVLKKKKKIDRPNQNFNFSTGGQTNIFIFWPNCVTFIQKWTYVHQRTHNCQKDHVWSCGTVQDSGVLDREFEPC